MTQLGHLKHAEQAVSLNGELKEEKIRCYTLQLGSDILHL